MRMRDPLRKYRTSQRKLKKIHLLIILAVSITIFPFVLVVNTITTRAVDFTWTQTDWSGGVNTNVITSNSNTFVSQSSVDYATPGEIFLGATENWSDGAWSYRKSVNLSNTGSTLSNYQVMVTINTQQLVSLGKLQNDCDDLRFTTSTGTQLSYYMDPDSTCNTASTDFWVKVTSIPAGASVIHMYYGNIAASNVQNAENTFEFFDEFTGSSLDAAKWQTGVGATIPVTITGGYMLPGYVPYNWSGALANGMGVAQNQIKYGVVDDVAVEWKSYMVLGSTLEYGQSGFAFVDSSNLLRAAMYHADTNVNTLNPYYGNFIGTTVGSWTEVNGGTSRFKLVRNGTSVTSYRNNAQQSTGTMTVSPTKITYFKQDYYPNGGSCGGNCYMQNNRIFWVFTRKSAATPPTISSYGVELGQYADTGTLESNIFDTGFSSNWNALTFTKTGSGTATVRIRTGNASDLSDATAFASCNTISTGADISTNNCVTDGHRYLQYQVSLSASGTSPTLTDISISYTPQDSTAPSANSTNVQLTGLSNNDWAKIAPTITWTAGTDAGVGIAGYCVSLDEVPVAGSSSTLNPITSSGKFTGLTDASSLTPTVCPYIVSGNSLDLSTVTGLTLTSGNKYYFSLKAVDLAGNVWTGASNLYQDLVWFRFDNTLPTAPSFISMPSNFISTKDVTITWPTSSGGASDADSGLAGLQYRIGASGTWFGNLRNGNQDLTDLLLNNGTYTTDATVDYPLLQEGVNVIYFRSLDYAGNASLTISGALKLNTIAPQSIQNLTATPTDNNVNSYAFSWDLPSSFSGSADNLTYCYTINTLPTVNTCQFTSAGATNVSADAYASQPGDNTFYVVAKDEAGNINYATAESVTFTYSGSAPGIPQNLDVSDISNKDTQDWKLAVTWNEPTNVGAGISTYRVYRAIGQGLTCANDFGLFSQVSVVQDVSYINTGLSQQYYSYCVRACDSANNCSAVSGSGDELPTGKYTTPATLVAGPTTQQISTRKAVVSWSTNRTSDSKIQYGTQTGVYFEEEFSKSAQVTEHVITLNNLQPGTVYYYRAKWTDEDGNTGISEEKTFKTEPAPEISNVQTSSVGVNFALVKFTSVRAQKVNIYYGKTSQFGGLQTINTSIQESQSIFQLTGLDDGTKYYFKINPFDLDGFEYEGTTLDFTTVPRPRVLDVQIEEVKGTAQPTIKVNWNSNTEISSIVTFYPASNSGLKQDVVNVTPKTKHELKLISLEAETRYVLTVRGIDKLGNEALSTEYSFTTATDSRPPVISNLNVETAITNSTEVNNAQIVVSWTTDELSTSQVLFGEGINENVTQSTTEDKNLKFNHVIVISNLNPSQVYTIRAVSRDSQRNETQSADNVTVTPSRTDSALELILQNVSDIFGI